MGEKKPVRNCNWGDWKKLLGGRRHQWKYSIVTTSNSVCVCVWTGEPGLCSWYPGGYVLDGARCESLGAIDSLVKHPDCLSGPFSLLFGGYQGSFLETQRPGHGVNHSCPVSELRMNEDVLLLHSWCGEGQHSLDAEQGSVSGRIV